MTAASILVAGSANLDFVVRAPNIPAPGETVLGHGFQTHPGGKGANQAMACARAGGVPTQMLLALGNDSFAGPVEASLTQAGVRLHIVRAEALPTGMAFICVADNAENAITVAPGANDALAPHHLPPLSGVGHLLLQLETPLPSVTAYASAAREAGVTVVLNAAPARRVPAGLLAAIDVLIVNEGELAAIGAFEVGAAVATRLKAEAGSDARAGFAHEAEAEAEAESDIDTDENADGDANIDTDIDIERRLAASTVPTVIVTLGARGCMARHAGQTLHSPAFKVDAVDTTAAGDTFCGALVAALASGEVLPDALRRASAAAAIACTRHGAQSSVPTRDEVDAFLRSH